MRIEIVKALAAGGITLSDSKLGKKDFPSDRTEFLTECSSWALKAGAANIKAANRICQSLYNRANTGA